MALNQTLMPQETKKLNCICPQRKKKLTAGVLHRVDNLADREENFIPENHIPYKSIVPLKEILADVLSKGKKTKTVDAFYHDLIQKEKNEFNILLNSPVELLETLTEKNRPGDSPGPERPGGSLRRP